MASLPIIDPQALEQLRLLNPADAEGFVLEVAGLFLADTPARLAELASAPSRGDVAAFIRTAHSIKGSATNLGAAALRAAAEALEHRARDQGFEGTEELVAAVGREFERAEAELRRQLPDLPGPAPATGNNSAAGR